MCGQESKVGVCLKCGIELFIDDKENVLDEISRQGIQTLRMCAKTCESKHKIVHNWLEIEKIVKERGENDGKNN